MATALLWPDAELAPQVGVEIRRGEVLNPGAPEAVLGGHDAVLSYLGLRRANPRNPWPRLLSPPAPYGVRRVLIGDVGVGAGIGAADGTCADAA